MIKPAELQWLGQISGVPLDETTTITAQRRRLKDSDRHRHGSAPAFSRSVTNEFPRSDTRSGAALAWEPVACRRGHYTGRHPPTGTFITTFGEFGRTFATFADLAAECPTFADLANVDRIHLDVVAAASPETPAGTQLFHLLDSAVAGSLPVASAVGAAGPMIAGGSSTAT